MYFPGLIAIKIDNKSFNRDLCFASGTTLKRYAD